MKYLEYIGVYLAAFGFTLLSAGYYKLGFTLGFFSCILLIPFFMLNKNYGLMCLQIYFACANIYGIVN